MISSPQNIAPRSISEKILIVLIFLGSSFFLLSSVIEDITQKEREAVMVVEKEKYKDTYIMDYLRDNVIALGKYKLAHDGIYPDNFQSSGMRFNLYDSFDREIYYKVAADKKSYDMRGLGEDGLYGTADDVIWSFDFSADYPKTATEIKIDSRISLLMFERGLYFRDGFLHVKDENGEQVTIFGPDELDKSLSITEDGEDLIFSIISKDANVLAEYIIDQRGRFKIDATDNLWRNISVLGEYKKTHSGLYPDNLQVAGSYVKLYDNFDREIYYKVAEDKKSYDMRGLGEDGLYGTADDVIASLDFSANYPLIEVIIEPGAEVIFYERGLYFVDGFLVVKDEAGKPMTIVDKNGSNYKSIKILVEGDDLVILMFLKDDIHSARYVFDFDGKLKSRVTLP